jgi:transposase
MSRRGPPRNAKRVRQPLAEVDTNIPDHTLPDVGLLSLASAAVQQPSSPPSPPRPRKKRGKYRPRLTTEQRLEILRMWISEGQDAPHIIAHFARQGVQIPKSTLDNIIRNQRKEGRVALKNKQHRRPKYSTEEREALAKIQKDHNNWSYDQVRAEWRLWWSRKHHGEDAPTPSNYILNSAFIEFGVTTKNLEYVPVARNEERLIIWRKEYSEEAIAFDRERLIFVDETGFDKHVHRRRGRSERGMPAHASETNNQGNRINMCAAVSPVLGLVMYRCILTSYNTEEFAAFMQDLLDQPLLQNRSCIICMDNVNWHHKDEVHDVLRAGRVEHHIKRIPSYSPHLNPIEYVFSVWKAGIKREDQTTTSITLQQQIDQAAPLVTDHLVSRCLDHVYRYYIHCMKSLPLEDFDPRLDDGQATERKTEEKEREEKEEKE